MEILSVLWSFIGKYRNLAELHEIFTQSLESSLWKKGTFRAVELDWLYSHLCICMCLRCPFACLTKQKKWISCVCQSSSRFTNNNNYFCIVKLHGSPGHLRTGRASDTQHKSTNWNGGSISIRWSAWKPPKSVKSTSGNFSCLEKIWF